MDQRDNRANDSDSPTMPGTGLPGEHVGAAAQTPPPLSDAVTMPHQSPIPGSRPVAPSSFPSSVAASSISAFLGLQPGVVFGGRYEILRVLGQGGMGAVYQARDRELDRLIALKVIRPELATDPAILQRFKQELILARNITHKNVVRIYDLGEADGIRFITMEYVDGEDLRTMLRHHGKFSSAGAIPIIEQVCRALDAAHSEGVIHRDLKPQNIMRDKQGRVVVMDFGLARSLGDSGMTQTGAIVGTMEYMSPEQALGSPLDQRSDIFSVGLIFYELLTGKSPYHADTAIASLMRRTREVAIPASDVDNSVPRSLSAIVSRCLEREPANRYHSVVELLQQLKVWEANPNISAEALSKMIPHPIIHPSRFKLDLPGERWMWLAGAVLVIAMAAFVGRTLLNRPGPRTEQSVKGIPALSQGKYVAILPLKIVGDEKALGYVGDGIQEALAAKLFQLKEVHLASSSAVEKVATKDTPLSKLAHELGVNLILQGMVQGNNDKLSVILTLYDAATGNRLWSQEFPGIPQDLLALEDQIYSSVVSALALKPSNEELARTGAHPTENVKAYDLYLQGRNVLRNSHNTAEMRQAGSLFEQAIEKDSNFALAYAGLADASLRLYGESKESIWAQKATLAAQQAERLSSTLPEVHFSLGSVYSTTGKNAQAITELKRALELAPNSDEAYRRLGDAYLANGQSDDAIVAYQNAVSANAYFWLNHNSLGTAYFNRGDTAKALPSFQKVVELASDNPMGYENIGSIYLREGKWMEAIPQFQKALTIAPDSFSYSNLGTAYFFLRNYDESVKMYAKATEMTPNSEELFGNLGDAYRWSGHSDQAAVAYDKAISLAFQQLQVNPRSAVTMGDLAVYYAKKGDARNALQYIQQARSISPADVQMIYWEAVVKALVGKPEEALKPLRLALEKGYPAQEAWNDPELQKLQALPQFSQLVKEFTPKTAKP
ncbi:MAG: protein kinase [Acidobacteriales bacterium]|nr:protein kinase [Candidatus Koribacter versatilis]MBI3646540.1 protein kinase [Terriglobales bacterium]